MTDMIKTWFLSRLPRQKERRQEGNYGQSACIPGLEHEQNANAMNEIDGRRFCLEPEVLQRVSPHDGRSRWFLRGTAWLNEYLIALYKCADLATPRTLNSAWTHIDNHYAVFVLSKVHNTNG